MIVRPDRAPDSGVVVGHAGATEDVGHLYRQFLLRDGLAAGVRRRAAAPPAVAIAPLGDGSAYLVGTALALLLALAWHDQRPLALRSGSRLLAGDRGHIYDQLVGRGFSRNAAVGTYVVVQAILASVAVGAVHLPSVPAGGVAAACALVLLAAVAGFGFLAPTSPETAA